MGSIMGHKPGVARCRMRSMPEEWLRGATLDERDRALLDAHPVPFFALNQSSYLRKIYHMQAGKDFEATEWLVETDDKCKELVRSAGGQLIGFDLPATAPVYWASVTVNVNIQGAPGAGFDWGFLSTRPSDIRIFKGPPETCSLHPWDAMILRDCTPNTDTLGSLEYMAGRKWDILLMKMREDYDHPWVVVAIKYAGAVDPGDRSHNCQDTSACGCVFEDSDQSVD